MSRTTSKDQLIAWLDDAYAMETGLIAILRNHASQFSAELPDVSRRLEQHIVETQQHAQRVQDCLRILNAAPSGVKSTLSSLMGTVEGAATALFTDQLVKNTLADYASEQFEVACYTALMSAATRLGHRDIADLCRQNLHEDLEMSTWLLRNLPAVVAHDNAPAGARQ